MRIKSRKKKKFLSIRVIKKFLFFPKKINNEWRWFEKAKYKQKLIRRGRSKLWHDERWLD